MKRILAVEAAPVRPATALRRTLIAHHPFKATPCPWQRCNAGVCTLLTAVDIRPAGCSAAVLFETEMHTSLLLRALSMLLALLVVSPARGEDLSREYRIKAAYLYNLTKFIVWPDEDTKTKNAPITICVYGYNPFENYLEKLRERPVRDRTIAIRYVEERQSVDDCQLLFISQHNTNVPKLLSAAPPYPFILTVSDDEDFLARGGIVSLVTVNNNVQLDINLTRAKQTGFSVSANLLEIAHRIQ